MVGYGKLDCDNEATCPLSQQWGGGGHTKLGMTWHKHPSTETVQNAASNAKNNTNTKCIELLLHFLILMAAMIMNKIACL